MSEDRQRFVYKEWVRDPKGKLLEKPPPRGKRTENNIIWGHSLDDFYWIPRIPGVNVLTIWSRSMIQAFGENYLKERHDPEPEPRRLRPWPVLTLPEHLSSASELGYIDEGCTETHSRAPRRVQDEVVETPNATAATDVLAAVAPTLSAPASSAPQDPPLVTDEVAVVADAVVAEIPVPVAMEVDADSAVSAPAPSLPLNCSAAPAPPPTLVDAPTSKEDAASPTAGNMQSTGWTSGSSEWAAAKSALPLPGDAARMEVDVAVVVDGEVSSVTAVSDAVNSDAVAMDIDAPSGENGDSPKGNECGPASVVEQGDAPKVEASGADTAKPDVDGMDVDIDGRADNGVLPEASVAAETSGAADLAGATVGGDNKATADANSMSVAVEPLVPATSTDVPQTATASTETAKPAEAPPKKQSPPPFPKPIFHDLPKLEEFIPEAYFPDILYVNDPDEATMASSHYYYSRMPAVAVQSQERVPRKYKRVWPRFARDTEPATAFNTDVDCASIRLPVQPAASSSGPAPATCAPPVVPDPSTNLRIAHLNLSGAPFLGVGNHSVVHRAALRLPRPLGARSPTGEVTVAAKTGFPGSEARQLLLNEGKIYGAFPAHLMEDWCGLNLVAPITHPVPVHAVVPKFYGYYVPVREDIEREKQEAVRSWKEKKRGERADEAKARALEKAARAEKRKQAQAKLQNVASTDEEIPANKPEGELAVVAAPSQNMANDDDGDSEEEDEEDEEKEEDEKEEEKEALRRFKLSGSYKAWQRMSPILLLEECGTPIVPITFTPDARSECYSMALRLHYAEFTQGSFYVRNFLMQPGPLTVAPSARSTETPSFRIIDFGRGEHWPYQLEAAKTENELRRKKSKTTLRELMKVPTEEEMKQRVEEAKREDAADERALKAAGKAWWESRDYEVRKAHSELRIRDFHC